MSFKYKQLLIKSLYVFIDYVLICFSIYLACRLRPTTLPFDINIFSIFFSAKNPFQFIFVFWKITTILVLNSRALYQTRREALEGYEIGLLFRAMVFSGLIVIVTIFGLKIEGFPRTVFFIGSGFIFIFLAIWRALKKVFVTYIVSRGYNNFNVLIVGAGKVGRTLTREIQKKPGYGLKIIGYLDDFKENVEEELGSKVLGKISDFKRIARSEFVDKIFITTHHDSKAFFRILEDARDLGISVRVIPQGFELMSGDFFKYNIGVVPILEYSNAVPFRRQLGKRLFDCFVVIVPALLLLPVYLLIAILVKLDSRGPVFYFSKRYGRSGRKFKMIKFRTMRTDADDLLKDLQNKNEVDGPIFKIKNDPRITDIGKILRKYSLDELPQLFNVLLGDMSLVGPRPLPIEQIRKEDLKQLRRLEVRPGITGLWQIRGRSDVSFKRLIRWDLWYIKNWSIWLDLNILWKTVPVVIKGHGAY